MLVLPLDVRTSDPVNCTVVGSLDMGSLGW